MKILKYVGVAALIIICLPLIVALFVSKDFNYEKSMIINAPVDSVWMFTSSLKGLDQWSPWNDYDPNMKKDWSGNDGEVGATQSWESEVENVGRGSQTITSIQSPSRLETTLKFYEPYESEASSYVKLEPDGPGTKVTWGFKSQMPYPMNITKLFMNMDEMMGNDFTKGLGKLKALSEE